MSYVVNLAIPKIESLLTCLSLSFFLLNPYYRKFFKVHGDEIVVMFKPQKYYVWFLVDHKTNLIVAQHASTISIE
ncbi:MAG: hypothetical protein HPY87_00045 [Fervidobacterium sp.]|uniref:hypothetical protein n=1 Tax=Fervidobacterium sp. TaxID=1871331 RepID=UPI0025BDF28F|nr:hypothetical protein [Fervidobacterium sp.]NPU88328.1 hypothetical protein [Fervidobacterium sp.]